MDNQELKEIIALLNDDKQDKDTDSIQIDWKELSVKLLSKRKFIMRFTAVFMLIGLFFGITLQRKYSVTTTLVPELSSSKGSSSLSGIASMLGLGSSVGGTSDAYSVTIYPEIISSTPFLTGLFEARVIDKENDIDTTLVGYLTREKGFSISKFLGFGSDSIESLTPVNVTCLTKKQGRIIKYLNTAISSDVDKKTGQISISVTMDNPYVAATVADSVCRKLQHYITDYRTKKSREDLAYYEKLTEESKLRYEKATEDYAYYRDRNRNLNMTVVESEVNRLQNEMSIAGQIYSQMKQQAEMARAKVQEQKPVFAVIQPASVPLKPSNSRKTPVIIWTFLGFVFSISWVLFLKDLYTKVRGFIRK